MRNRLENSIHNAMKHRIVRKSFDRHLISHPHYFSSQIQTNLSDATSGITLAGPAGLEVLLSTMPMARQKFPIGLFLPSPNQKNSIFKFLHETPGARK